MAGMAEYSATKAAVAAYTRGWARDLGPKHITVNTVQPGPIETDMGNEVIDRMSALSGAGANEAREMIVSLHPLGHMGQASDVANAIAFLASDRAAFMTGSELVVDGGWILP